MLRVNLIFVGHFKVFIDKKRIKQFKSSVFEIEETSEILNIDNADSFPYLVFTDDKIREIIKGKLSHKDEVVNVLISCLPLEDNWYARILGENLSILSLYETGDILLASHIKLENFIIKNILKLSAIYHLSGKKLSTQAYGLAHDEIRRCLFDMNYDKTDIVFNTNSAQLCTDCDAVFDRASLPEGFKKNLKEDLKKLKKDFFYRLYDFVQKRPKVSIVIATGVAILINILSNYLYELLMGRANLPNFLVSPFIKVWNYFL